MDQVRKFAWGAVFSLAVFGLMAVPVFAADDSSSPSVGTSSDISRDTDTSDMDAAEDMDVSSSTSDQDLGVSGQFGYAGDMSKSQVSISNLFPADKLIGMKVRNNQGDDLGSIKDFALLSGQDKVSYAVFEHGGFLGIGEKYVAIPLSALTVSSDQKSGDKMDHYVLLNVDKDTLKNAPSFDRNNWPAQADASWLGAQASAAGASDHSISGNIGGVGVSGSVGSSGVSGNIGSTGSASSTAQVIKLSDVLGWKVASARMGGASSTTSSDMSSTSDTSRDVNASTSRDKDRSYASSDHDNIGKIHNALIDVKESRLAFAILSFDSSKVSGLDNKYVAVPWSTIQLDDTAHLARLSVDPNQLTQFAFDKNQLPKLDDSNYVANLRSIISGSSSLGGGAYGYVGDESMTPGTMDKSAPSSGSDTNRKMDRRDSSSDDVHNY